LEPLTSTPINGTKIKKKRQTRNNIIEIFNKLSFSIDEKKKIKKIPINIYNKCFKKK